jgi:hypothetical protein
MKINILFLAYEIWFYLPITSIKILLLLFFPYTTKTIRYVVDRGILWKLEVALGQQVCPGLAYRKNSLPVLRNEPHSSSLKSDTILTDLSLMHVSGWIN